MDAQPEDAYSSDEEGGGQARQGQGLHPAVSDASFNSTSTAANTQQRFKVGVMACNHREELSKHKKEGEFLPARDEGASVHAHRLVGVVLTGVLE